MGDYWQLTVDVLQAPDNPIVDKPKLVEKYLTKPPFRYLHDIVTAVGKCSARQLEHAPFH
jgi:TRAF3-interacting protein 1